MSPRTPYIVRAAIVALVAVTAVAAAPLAGAQPTRSTDRTDALDRSAALVEHLERTRVDAEYVGIDFDEIIGDLREKHGLNIHVSWGRLQTQGVRRDQPVTVRLRDVPLATVLDVLLREVGTAMAEVSYQVDGSVIIVSSGEDLARHTVLRAYDLTDLIESGYAIRRFANTPVLSMKVTGREFVGGERRERSGGGGGFGGGGGAGAGEGGGGGALFGEPDDDGARPSTMERMQLFIGLIMEKVDPDSWRDFGGAAGSIRQLNGVLLIRHTLNAHRRIEAFLDLVRGLQPRALDMDAIIVRVHADRVPAWRQAIGPGFPRLSRTSFERLLHADDREGILLRATSAGLNGRRFWFSALTQRDVLTGMRPIVSEGSSAFDPRTGVTTEGLELIVLPLVAPNGEDLTLDVQMAWVPTTEVAPRSITLAPGETTGTLDQVARRMRTVSTALRLRVGEGIALSIPAEIPRGGLSSPWEDWLLVRVQAPTAAPPRE